MGAGRVRILDSDLRTDWGWWRQSAGPVPFRPALTRGINLTATTIIVGGLGWQVCDAVAGGLASFQVLRATGWTLDFWPIWVGLALFAVAAVFRYGQKLQRDFDELV
ncbi:hypothetical protein [Cryobacterium aureum]|uniref:hypothetical protein n=1 Tax=Cryobacterium aureum TaxID=995037 RepID=UPI000CF4F0E1|nr:hypothetical protein [Cryobacterium aureum]